MKSFLKLAIALCFLTLTCAQNRRPTYNRRFSTTASSTTTTTTTTTTSTTTTTTASPSPSPSPSPSSESSLPISFPTATPISSTQDGNISCLANRANDCFLKVPIVFTELIHGNKENRDTEKVIDNVCSTISDSLACTQDIIDESCSEQQGKNVFDAWKETFNSTVNFACGYNRPIAGVLVNQSDCWNFGAFLSCVEKNTQLKSIQNLMEVQLDQESCRKLDEAFANCNEEIPDTGNETKNCTSNEYRLTTLATTKLLHHFLSNSYCSRHLDFGVNVEQPNGGGGGEEEDENKGEDEKSEEEDKEEEIEHGAPEHMNGTNQTSHLPVNEIPTLKEGLNRSAPSTSFSETTFSLMSTFLIITMGTIIQLLN